MQKGKRQKTTAKDKREKAKGKCQRQEAKRQETLIESVVFAGGVLLGGSYGLGTLIFTLGVGPSYQFFKHRVWSGWPESTGRFIYRR